MDPDATLAQALEAGRAILDGRAGDLEEAARELADRFLALDAWVAMGGYLPVRWRPTALPPELRA